MHAFLVDRAPTDREAQRLRRVAQPHACGFLTAVPSSEDGHDCLMRPRNFRIAVAYRLGVAVIKEEIPCPLCKQTINIYGDHATCCVKVGDIIIRHNAIRNLVNSFADDGVLSPVLEKKGILGNTTGRRPGDVSIPLWHGGKGLALDVAVTSPLTQSSVRLLSPCNEYATTQKHGKYDVSFEGTSYEFGALVFETLGAINCEGQVILRDVFRLASKNLGREFSSYCGRAWARLSCCLQRSVSQEILNRIDGAEFRDPPEVPPVPRCSAVGRPHFRARSGSCARFAPSPYASPFRSGSLPAVPSPSTPSVPGFDRSLGAPVRSFLLCRLPFRFPPSPRFRPFAPPLGLVRALRQVTFSRPSTCFEYGSDE